MDSSLHEVWQAAAGSPFLPTIGKGSQFLIGFVLLLVGLTLTGGFALSMSLPEALPWLAVLTRQTGPWSTSRFSVYRLPLPLRSYLTRYQ